MWDNCPYLTVHELFAILQILYYLTKLLQNPNPLNEYIELSTSFRSVLRASERPAAPISSYPIRLDHHLCIKVIKWPIWAFFAGRSKFSFINFQRFSIIFYFAIVTKKQFKFGFRVLNNFFVFSSKYITKLFENSDWV